MAPFWRVLGEGLGGFGRSKIGSNKAFKGPPYFFAYLGGPRWILRGLGEGLGAFGEILEGSGGIWGAFGALWDAFRYY